MEHLTAHGATIPALGFGTWQLRGQACREGVRHALELGYRHVDTARMYGNEAEVGAGIADADVERDEVFVVTKLQPGSLDRDAVAAETEASLTELDMDHVDLLLIHHPSSRVPLEETLEAMLEQQEAGHTRHLGVSNFDPDLMRRASELAPVVTNQVEYHPGRSQDRLLAAARDLGIVVTAYSPLDVGGAVGDRTLTEVGRAYGKSASQVALRWLLDQAVAVIPRSGSAEHRRENLEVFDFTLSEDDHRRIAGLAA